MKKLLLVSLIVLGVFVTPNLSIAETTSETIARLLAQIQVLQAQILQLQNQNNESCFTFNKNLGVGVQNEDVTHLARVLVKEGLMDRDYAFQDGRTVLNYDENYAAAVSQF